LIGLAAPAGERVDNYDFWLAENDAAFVVTIPLEANDEFVHEIR
jgi:hypothetical protein